MGEILVCDLEADGLYDTVTQIHCICIKRKGEKDVDSYFDDRNIRSKSCIRKGSILDAVRRLGDAKLVVYHNGIDYDIRVIKKFYPEFKFKPRRVRDTLIRSYLFNPHRKKHKDCPTSKTTIDGRKPIGAHSLENWGYVVGRGKVEHEDWSKLTEEMLHRCVEDAHITDLVDDYLEKESKGWDWSEAEHIEKQFRYILSEQEGHGVLVDRGHLDWCIEQLTAEVVRLEKKILPKVPVNIIKTEKPTKGLNKDGSITAYNLSYFKDLQHTVCGNYCKVRFEPINLNSDKQIKEFLLTQGWKPTEWNYKKIPGTKQLEKDKHGKPIRTSPKLTDDSMGSVSGSVGRHICKHVQVQHKLSQFNGWRDRVRMDGRLGAGGNSIGTNTGRVTHRVVVNVTKAEDGEFYGKESRQVFTVPDGYVMVGADLSALENRIAGHYTYKFDGGEYAERILKGDPHQYIADMLGIDRSPAKNINYAIMYGAGIGKIMSMLGCDYKGAQHRLDQWWDANPALKRLKSSIESALAKHPGYLRGIDGRKIFIRSPHSAMNALFQCAGSMVNKVATIYIYKAMKKKGIRGNMILNFHDEQEIEVVPEDVKKLTKIIHKSYKKAGKYLNLNIPIEGEVQEGKTWADVH